MVLRLRFHDFSRATRSHTLPGPTAETAAILFALRHLLHASTAMICDRGITLIGISLSNLDDDGSLQLELPWAGRGPGSTARSTGCASATARPHSPAGCCSALIPVLTVPLLPD